MRAALPVLARALRRPGEEEVHPSVGLLAGAAPARHAAGGRGQVRAGRWGTALAGHPARRPGHRPDRPAGRLPPRRRPRPRDRGAAGARRARVRRRLDAAQCPATRRRSGPRSRPGRRSPSGCRRGRCRQRKAGDLPQLVRISLRVEADEEELVAGAVRLVAQVHDEQDPLHLCEAALLWTDTEASHGFGDRARTHASIALRGAAEAWPVLDRLLELRVPDEITLDGDELASLLEDGVAALKARGVDVLWPRSLGRDLTATTVLDRRPTGTMHEEPLQDPLLGAETLFTFNWQLALHGDPLTQDEMDQLAASASPVLKLRGSWTVVDPAMARKARKRLLRTVKPAQAVAAALTGVVQVDLGHRLRGGQRGAGRGRRQPAQGARPAARCGDPRADRAPGRAAGDPARLPAARPDLAAPSSPSLGLGALPRRRHGPRQDGHPDRAPPAPPERRLGAARRWWSARPACSATGRPRSSGSRRASPYAASTAPTATLGEPRRRLRAHHLRHHAPRRREARRACPGTCVVADEAQHVKNPHAPRPPQALRTIPSRARVALTGTPVENNLTELWAILDWATPGLLGSRNAFRKVWAAPIEAGRDPTKAPAVRRADRPVPAAPAQVRPRHRSRAAGQDRDRPPCSG